MIIVIANSLPAAVRGRMKLWFVEPKPNVFVSGMKESVAKTVIEYLYQHCPSESGLIVFRSIREAPGYEILGIGDTSRRIIEITGLQLIAEKINLDSKEGQICKNHNR